MRELIEAVDSWLEQGKKVVLATVAETWGSAPRRVGAKMAVCEDGRIVGSVSGGCVEAAVVEEASAVFANGVPRLPQYGVSDDNAWSVGLSCGGKLTVWVESLSAEWWRPVSKSLRENHPIATATVLTGPQAGAKVTLVERDQAPLDFGLWTLDFGLRTSDFGLGTSDLGLGTVLREAALSALKKRRSERRTVAGIDLLAEFHPPQPRLLIIGGAHVAVALHSLARTLGFRVILIDPRRVFASRERFPEAEEIHHDYPQEILPRLALDSETYVAVLTHDPKIDDPAMLEALPSPAPYVGVLSSRKTHEKRVKRLLEAGLEPRLLDRIHVPIGLDIGASTPEEIALAILAEIVAVRNGRN